jgi:hypothetical protein
MRAQKQKNVLLILIFVRFSNENNIRKKSLSVAFNLNFNHISILENYYKNNGKTQEGKKLKFNR